jgi:hypothetical protein
MGLMGLIRRNLLILRNGKMKKYCTNAELRYRELWQLWLTRTLCANRILASWMALLVSISSS